MALILFCSIPVIYRIFPLEALPMTFIGAAMGAVITIGITYLLLREQSKTQKELLVQQSKTEEEKELHIKVFEKKAELFQDFINQSWEIWTNEKITCGEFKKLTSDYYKNLMLYMKDEARLDEIGNAISELGDCLEKESYTNTQQLHDNIIKIINALSRDLELGGQIDNKKHIIDHDFKLFVAKFRKAMLESFDRIFVSAYPEIFDLGHWKVWDEGNHIHDDMVFDIKNSFNNGFYTGCSIRFGFSKNKNNSSYDEGLTIIFYAPTGANYHKFDKFRPYKGNHAYNRRIAFDGYQNILKTEEPKIELNNFEKDGIKKIRENSNFGEIAETLAQRAKELFPNLVIKTHNTEEKLSIIDFIRR